MTFLFLLLGLSAWGGELSKNSYEKTFPRDNSFCYIEKKRLEIMIRSEAKMTDPQERGYGEYLFYRNGSDDEKPILLSLNSSRAETYKFFYGKNTLCSKSLGFKLDKKTMAILFLKENVPYHEKLVIQLFDTSTMSPKESIETEHLTDRAEAFRMGFAFRSYIEDHTPEMGKITIQGENYIYQERHIPIWMSYTIDGFRVLPDKTFQEFPWKSHFNTHKEFLTQMRWSPQEKQFFSKYLYTAINHATKKECLLIAEKKQELTGAENWHCQTM